MSKLDSSIRTPRKKIQKRNIKLIRYNLFVRSGHSKKKIKHLAKKFEKSPELLFKFKGNKVQHEFDISIIHSLTGISHLIQQISVK